ncbi:10-carbomethoxy-13-deoxycarminomycin esterase/esterase [Lentzea atacamensis]|uniref:10-carbomethoxy-13-deoxycarminomycin esterase/esterase n=1 Tax=Lentzea atacamensis TaxID=531938 RepID=A0ABX9EIB1_9PSEU|nr:alpha/beta fold hydrolase [Lentzea atacamensis]RAS70927.1 10-carbomethoxy-13-deoxycarminomycin esterase/esterase [Lentzea atacamensis]
MAERVVETGQVRLWSEDLGDPAAPPIFLIMGANASAMGWPDEFVELLVGGGYRVIRYDHRDTGKSTTVPDATYDFTDLAQDALAVLDAHGVDKAHVVGVSMGGLIGQLLAVDHPGRLRSLTLALTGALDMGTTDETQPDNGERISRMIALAEPGADVESELERRVALWRELHGDKLPFDAAEYRRLEERAIAHAGTFLPATGHVRLGATPLPRGAEDLRKAETPTLVLQASEDPFYPLGFGRHLAGLLPDARLLELDGMGHSIPATMHSVLADAILEHIRLR